MLCYDSVEADERNARQHHCKLFSGVCTKILCHIVSIAELSAVGCGRPEQRQY